MRRGAQGTRRTGSPRTATDRALRRGWGERSIVVSGEAYYWDLRFSKWKWATDADYADVALRVRVRPARGGASATLEVSAYVVDHLFTGKTQSVVIRPRVVRALILQARALGWPERGAVSIPASPELRATMEVPFDLEDERLRAACQQWFVPYPGRASLEAAYEEEGGNVERVAARFPKLHIEQVSRWLMLLGIAPKDG